MWGVQAHAKIAQAPATNVTLESIFHQPDLFSALREDVAKGLESPGLCISHLFCFFLALCPKTKAQVERDIM